MAICLFNKPKCSNFATRGGFCGTHQPQSKAERKQLENDVAMAPVRAAKAAAARAAQQKIDDGRREAARLASVKEENKRQYIAERVQFFSRQVDAVAAEVELLRKKDPNANAGHNEVGNTLGGSNCELVLVLTEPRYGATPAEIAPRIPRQDTSFSAGFKYIRGDRIFIHCKFS